MSLSETLMLIALGFALALVLVMLVGRAFWGMAMRVGARRHAKQIPTTMLELQADRDRLRAEHAMMSRKLELRLEDIKTRMTEQMAEVSRHRNRVQSMVQDLEHRDETIKIRDREVGALNAQLEVHKADLAACADAIDRLTADIASKESELTRQTEVIHQLSAKLHEKSTMVSNLGDELETALRLGNSTIKPTNKSDSSENRLLQRVAELTSISTQMINQRDGNGTSPLALHETIAVDAGVETRSRQSNLDQQLADTERESAAMAEQLKQLDKILSEKSSPEEVPAETPAEAAPKKSGAMANVISLAQRIRALQKGVE